MSGWRDGVLAAALAADLTGTAGCFCAAAQERQRAAAVCGGDEIGRGSLGHIIDGRTFTLADGREVRLAAVEVPPFPERSDARPEATAAKDALVALLSATGIVLRQAELPKPDRYGRTVAYVLAQRDGGEWSVQADLVAGGFARVGALVGARACAAELQRLENVARKRKLGLWADSYYDQLNADNPADVLAARGRFALVEGRVVSVRESGATIYVNFGRRWTEDFTVTILKRNARSFTAAGLEPKGLAGRRIRVRGWVEERGGPLIEAARPEQIEFADRQ